MAGLRMEFSTSKAVATPKVIKLSAEAEPDIYRTTEMFGTILENVVYDEVTRADRSRRCTQDGKHARIVSADEHQQHRS